MRTRLVLPAVALCAATALPAQAAVPADAHVEGRLPSGAAYVMDVPADWNGTVLLHSHDYTPAGSHNPARNRLPVGARPFQPVVQDVQAAGLGMPLPPAAVTPWSPLTALLAHRQRQPMPDRADSRLQRLQVGEGAAAGAAPTDHGSLW